MLSESQRGVVLSDLLVLQKVIQTGQSSKPADATRFEPAFLELHLEVGPAIHRDEAGIQAARYPNGTVGVAGPDPGAESIHAVVRELHRLIFGVKALER